MDASVLLKHINTMFEYRKLLVLFDYQVFQLTVGLLQLTGDSPFQATDDSLALQCSFQKFGEVGLITFR